MDRVPVLDNPTPITRRVELAGAAKGTGGNRTVETQTQIEVRNMVELWASVNNVHSKISYGIYGRRRKLTVL